MLWLCKLKWSTRWTTAACQATNMRKMFLKSFSTSQRKFHFLLIMQTDMKQQKRLISHKQTKHKEMLTGWLVCSFFSDPDYPKCSLIPWVTDDSCSPHLTFCLSSVSFIKNLKQWNFWKRKREIIGETQLCFLCRISSHFGKWPLLQSEVFGSSALKNSAV